MPKSANCLLPQALIFYATKNTAEEQFSTVYRKQIGKAVRVALKYGCGPN